LELQEGMCPSPGRGKHTSTADEVRGAMTELGESIGDMFEDMGGGVPRAVPHPRSTNKERTDSKQPLGWYSPHDEVPWFAARTGGSAATAIGCTSCGGEGVRE